MTFRDALLLFLSVAAALPAGAKTITIDGDPSDWTGTPPSQIHATAVDGDEWIYLGEAGDVRGDPSPASLPNYDITEVRLTHDAEWLYLLVRFDDIITTDEVSVCVGFDSDQSASDSNGLNFLGDDSGVGFNAGAEDHPEYIVQFHNAQSGTTWPEFFHDAGAGTWYTTMSGPDFADADCFLSDTNDVLEAKARLSAIGLSDSSTFGFSLVTFDNGSTADPSSVDFNNNTDTTVDYPGHDGLDGIGGDAGVSENAYDRVFPPLSGTDPGPYTGANVDPVSLPLASSVSNWELLD